MNYDIEPIRIEQEGHHPLILNRARVRTPPQFASMDNASMIEQLRKREDVQITEIKDEPDAVKVMGTLHMGDLEKPIEGVICCMMKEP